MNSKKTVNFRHNLYNTLSTIYSLQPNEKEVCKIGNVAVELRNEISEDQNARFLVYAELYRLTKDQNNKELTNIILKELLNMFLDDSINLKTAKETEIIREQIEKFAAY